MSELQVSIGEGIVVHFGIFLSGESVPRGRSRAIGEMERIGFLTD